MSTGDFNWSHDKFTSEVFICYIRVHDVVRLWIDPWKRAPIFLLAKGLKIEGFLHHQVEGTVWYNFRSILCRL